MRDIVSGGFAVLLVLGAPQSAGAQEVDPSFEADILKLMEVTGSVRMSEQMAALISTEMMNGFRKAHPQVPARAFDIVQEVVLGELATALSAPDGLMPKMIPLYAKYFDHEEVRTLLAFYQTDLGRKTIAVMPALMQEGAEVGRAWAADVMPRVEEAVQTRLRIEGLVK